MRTRAAAAEEAAPRAACAERAAHVDGDETDDEVLIGEWDPQCDDVYRPLRGDSFPISITL